MKEKCTHNDVWIEEEYLWSGYKEKEEYTATLKSINLKIICKHCKEIIQDTDDEEEREKIIFE